MLKHETNQDKFLVKLREDVLANKMSEQVENSDYCRVFKELSVVQGVILLTGDTRDKPPCSHSSDQWSGGHR